MTDFIPKKISYPIELYCLQRDGLLIPGKSKLRTTEGLLVFITVMTQSGYLQAILEDEKGESLIFNNGQFRDLECETVKPEEIRYESWVDPA